MIKIELCFKLICSFIFFLCSYNIHQAQNCLRLEIEIDASSCTNEGFTVTINAISDNGSTIDLSKNSYVIIPKNKNTPIVTMPVGSNVTKLLPGNYSVTPNNAFCNGVHAIAIATFDVGLKITKSEYKRCSSSDVSVSVAVSGGKGPYTYQLMDGNDVVAEKSDESNDLSFTATTTASNLKIKVIDDGCIKNTPVTNDLQKISDIGVITTVIEGDKAACKGGVIELSVKDIYQGHSFQWKKGNITLSTINKLKIENVTEADAGEYSLSMIINECSIAHSETFNIEIGSPPAPNVNSPVYICLNSDEVSISKYASVTSDKYVLVWYNQSNTVVNNPKFKPDLTGTTKYYVSQKNSDGCESSKAELSVIVEDLPAKPGENNIIFCISKPDLKPKIRVINAGNNTYNLYTSYSGGTQIGSGMAVNDTAVITTTQDLIVGNDYFLETQNVHGCLSSGRTTVRLSTKSLILGSNKICFGDNLALTADYAGGKIVWTKPDKSTFEGKTLNVNDMKPANAGIYSLFIEEQVLGCILRDEIKVTVTRPNPPVVDKKFYRFYENEAATALTATAKTGLTLKWYNPEGTLISGQSPKPATNKTGTFIYNVSQDSLGCESDKVPITVVVGDVPSSVPASDVNICIADKPVVKINNTVKDYKYIVYYKNDIIAQGTGNGGTISLTSNVTISENTKIGIVVSDIYDVNSEQTMINVISSNNLIDLQNSSSSVCSGSNGKLIAVDITGANYVWTTPKNGNINESSVSIDNTNADDAGKYTLSVTTSGCPVVQQTTELKVEKPAKPSVTKEIHYCTGDNAAKLTATPLSGYKLEWFDESQTLLHDAPTPNFSVAGTSKYYVSQVSMFDANCSSDKEEITVIVENKPDEVVLEPVNICYTPDDTKPLSIRIPVSSKGYTYNLYSQQTEGSLVGHATSNSDGSPVDITIDDNEISENKTYYLEVTNKAGCVSNRTPATINLIKITLSPNELPIYQLDELYSQKLETNVSDPQYLIVQGQLPIGFTLSSNGEISGTASVYADPSIFTVEVTDISGCSIQKDYILKGELMTSKIFSPNGDGINDVFMKGYKVIIFDRLGRKIFTGDDGWDGTFNGKIVSEDVYYYILYYKDKDGKENRVINYMTLIKAF
jgi:gliding motility-associated-like protein